MLPGPCRDKSIEVIRSRDEQQSNRHVRFTPESRHVQRTSPCPLCANSGHSSQLTVQAAGCASGICVCLCWLRKCSRPPEWPAAVRAGERPRYGRATQKSDEIAPLHVAPRLDSEPSTSRLGGELEMADPNVRFVPDSGHLSVGTTLRAPNPRPARSLRHSQLARAELFSRQITFRRCGCPLGRPGP